LIDNASKIQSGLSGFKDFLNFLFNLAIPSRSGSFCHTRIRQPISIKSYFVLN